MSNVHAVAYANERLERLYSCLIIQVNEAAAREDEAATLLASRRLRN